MGSFFIAIFLSLLITAHGVADNNIAELQRTDIYADHQTQGLEISSWASGHGRHALVDVASFGAVGDGISDDTQVCSRPKSVLLVPKGHTYLVNATIFEGPCAGRLTVQIDGKIIAPGEPRNWDPNLSRIWLGFANLTGAVFKGRGVIDGSGSKWWAASCKKNKTNPCTKGPTALTIDQSSSITVKDLTIQNSQQFHFTIVRSDSVRVSNLLITAPVDSPNTDGIHINRSTNVAIRNCKIGTGDDCISIIEGSINIKMKKIYCGPGHGISIGSLGKDNATDIVERIFLKDAFLRNTTNGLRIKSWQGGSGHAKAIRFQNVIMEDVANPIIIDQFYCDSTTPCANQTSAVQISEIMYRNIAGTTTSTEAMKFACSDTVPCKNIVLANINLCKKDGSVETSCNSATGRRYGIINPPADCLTSNDKDSFSAPTEQDCSSPDGSKITRDCSAW